MELWAPASTAASRVWALGAALQAGICLVANFSFVADRERCLPGVPGAMGMMLWVSKSCVCTGLFVFRVTDPEVGDFV